MAKYLGFYDECSISELLTAAYSFGADSVDVTDSEGDTEHFYFDDPDAVEDAVIELLDGGDEEYRFSFYKGEQHLGTFYIVLGNNDGSAVYDSSCQAWCDAIWEEIA